MLILSELLAFLAAFCLCAGLWERARRRRLRVATALGALRGDAGGGSGHRAARDRARRRALPGWIERRARAAGVDAPVETVLWIVAAAAAGLWTLAWALTGHPWIAGLAAAGGLYAPVWWVDAQARRRAERALRQLDQACQAIAQPMRAGASLQQALAAAAEELDAPLGPEIGRVVRAVRFGGSSLREAAPLLEERVRLPETRLLVSAMRLHLETGVDLPAILDGLARTLKDRREARGALLAATASGRVQARILVALPFVMLGLLRMVYPEYLDPLLGTGTGQVVFLASLAWLALGYRVMRRMVSVEDY